MESLVFDGSATSDRQCVNITILDDDLRESPTFGPQPEVFQVQLSVSSDAVQLGVQNASVAIEDNDCKLHFSFCFKNITWSLKLATSARRNISGNHAIVSPVVATMCSEVFSCCCFGFGSSCRLPQANCACDENCYRRRDCCDDIQTTCPRGETTHIFTRRGKNNAGIRRVVGFPWYSLPNIISQ